MTLEKKIAIASVALCLLTSLAFSIHLVFVASYLDEAETSDIFGYPSFVLGSNDRIVYFIYEIT